MKIKGAIDKIAINSQSKGEEHDASSSKKYEKLDLGAQTTLNDIKKLLKEIRSQINQIINNGYNLFPKMDRRQAMEQDYATTQAKMSSKESHGIVAMDTYFQQKPEPSKTTTTTTTQSTAGPAPTESAPSRGSSR